MTPRTSAGQDASPASTFIAFRVDGTHAIATLRVLDTTNAPQGTLSPEPPARFGFQYADAPPEWRAEVAAAGREGERWLVHVGGARSVSSVAEAVVAGQLGCQTGVGLLLRVGPESAAAFAALPAKYFLAERAGGTKAAAVNQLSKLRAVTAPSSEAFKHALETVLSELLVRELPGVRTEAEPELARMASS